MRVDELIVVKNLPVDTFGKINGVRKCVQVNYRGCTFGMVESIIGCNVRVRLFEDGVLSHINCTECGRVRTVANFKCYKSSNSFARICSECDFKLHPEKKVYGREYAREKYHEKYKERAKERYQQNKEKLITYNKEWKQDNPLRFKVSSANARGRKLCVGEFTFEEFSEVCERFRTGELIQCPYCAKETPYKLEGFHLEHFNPISKGGSNLISNVLPSCPHCNYAKQDTDFFEWSKDYFGYLYSMGFQRSPYQVQTELVAYFKEYYNIAYSDRINVEPDA